MKNKFISIFVSFIFAMSLLAIPSISEAHYQCRWIPAHWHHGHYIPAHKECWRHRHGHYHRYY